MAVLNQAIRTYSSLNEFYSDLYKNNFTFQSLKVMDPMLEKRANHYLKIFPTQELAKYYFIRQLLLPFAKLISVKNLQWKLHENVLELKTQSVEMHKLEFDEIENVFFTSVYELSRIIDRFTPNKSLVFNSKQTVVFLDCQALPEKPIHCFLGLVDPRYRLEISPIEIKYTYYHYNKDQDVKGLALSNQEGVVFSLKENSKAFFLISLILHSSKEFIEEIQKGAPASFIFLHVKAYIYAFFTHYENFSEYTIQGFDEIRKNPEFLELARKIIYEFSAEEWDKLDTSQGSKEVKTFIQQVKEIAFSKMHDPDLLKQLSVVYNNL